MRIDLHNHTHYCNHATGSMREYVLKAIEQNIDVFGFSEHAPMEFDKHYRLPFEKKELYEREVLALKKEFEKEINVVLAYEVDFMQNGLMMDAILNANVDYLIGSVHFIDQWGFDNPEFIGEYKNRDINTIWEDYFDAIEAMAKSQKFNIVGHLDLIKVFKYLPTKDIRLLAKKAIAAIKASNMVVEINASGLRKPIAEQYPSQLLLEACFEASIPITFGSDAHKVQDIGFAYESCTQLAKEIGFTKCALFENKEYALVTF
jgi:histidinol-phosphatase (PHP family)